MKVGIMSMQRIVNYGSFLQAYSLKKIIEEMGHDVEFVDYEPGEVLIDTRQSFSQKIRAKIIRTINKLSKKQIEKMEKARIATNEYVEEYKTAILPLLGVGNKRNIKPQLDVLVIGSDEVFNCLQTNPDVGYSKELFGAYNQSKKVISYAASFGNTTMENLIKYGIVDEIAGYLEKFDSISVRDLNSKNIVENLISKNAKLNIDPVFLYDYSALIPQNTIETDYIVVYAYWSRITKQEAKKINLFAKKNNKKIICLCSPQFYLDNFIAANPFEILAYIRDADYVVTDTFHGAVFSIKYNKNFAVFLRNGHGKIYGNSEKLSSLLNYFNLDGQIISNLNTMETILKTLPEYKKVNIKISEEQEKSKMYFESTIGGNNRNGKSVS